MNISVPTARRALGSTTAEPHVLLSKQKIELSIERALSHKAGLTFGSIGGKSLLQDNYSPPVRAERVVFLRRDSSMVYAGRRECASEQIKVYGHQVLLKMNQT